MIRKALLSLLLVSFSLPLAAADAPPAGVLDWGKQLLGYCPDETFAVTPAQVPAPKGYTAWTIEQDSSWRQCRQKMTIYASPAQLVAGRALPIMAEPRPLDARIADMARGMLKKDVAVTIGSEKLADGFRTVQINFKTDEGMVPMGAFVDGSDSNLIFGILGPAGSSPAAAQLEALSSGAAVRGKKGAKVVILEISDLQCSGCQTMHFRLEPFLAEHLDDVEYRRIDLPLFEQHDWSLRASTGAKAIQKIAPAAYWDYIDMIFKRQPELSASTIDGVIEDFAEAKNLDWKAIQAEMRSPALRKELLAQVGKLYQYGVFATPTILVNGRIVRDAGDARSVIGYATSLLNAK